MRNQSSQYGGKFAAYSAYNQFASEPPLIIDDGEVLGYVTANEFKTPRIHPDVLIGCLEG
jgi:hypothetical protein